ncbi:MAG: DUF559 domain-containing protein [Propioniciclava sp.]|nr:DUF559 domain-containing protein [Propioniciclava sp.]
MSPNIERAVAERAQNQLGLITRPQLTDIGCGRKWIARSVDRGLLEPIGIRTFRCGGAPWLPQTRALAGCLDVDGVAWLATAAWLHRADGFGVPDRVQVLVPVGRGRRTPLAEVHRTTSLLPDDVVTIDGIRTASIARLILGLCSLGPEDLPSASLLAVTEAFIRDGRASMAWLWWFLEERRCRGRDGVSRMERLLAEMDSLGPTESWLERTTLRLLLDAGLPRPDQQVAIHRNGAFVSRVDFLWRGPKVVLEVEGKTHLTPAQQSVDARQRSELQLLGYKVLTCNHGDVTQDRERVIDMVRRAIVLPRTA